ncbi:class I SAM-dependent DNA methyltransferase [Pseudoxanthomonas koreensis]|uniref:class I SAM-dependent DNA methyltransferase n=1 Tax=Pseudoxanthomonas koreensis TaxID=266061 RepID=UPI0035A573AF
MTPQDFIAKWKNGGDERRDFQSFFDDLCRLMNHPTPREADPEHKWFTYEYGANKTSGGEGWADAWKRGFFGFEAKGTGKDLDKAYAQLKMYADALQNPPLLIVCDLQRFEIHTNFTNAVKQVHRFTVEDLANHDTRRLLAAAFNDPQQLRPGTTRADITKEAAGKFATLAEALRKRGHEPHAVAHFLNRLLFCMFAEDIGLLPDHIFSKLVRSVQDKPDQFESRAASLFAAMKDGGDFALNAIEWFNGGLFEDAATLALEAAELKTLLEAATLDWAEIDPSIFGTLFERGLDPSKRSQLGAHYTDPDTIMKIVRPVVVAPLLAEWETEKAAIAATLEKSKAKGIPKAAQDRLNAFLERMRNFRVLDPACGSGNFLFVSLRALKDLENRILFEAETLGLGRQVPAIGPVNVLGIELNEYAAELARITVWIGEIQWMVQNGFGVRTNPILQALGGIENRDALMNADGSEAQWPAANVIVGNPPFIGDKKMVGELGADYAAQVRKTYAGRVPGGADFVCYWFEKANDAIKAGNTQRAGLVATNSIRGGASREVLKHAAETTRIFEAWDDEEWTNEGAAVRVSLVCFGHSEQDAKLDGEPVGAIFADLTASNEDGEGTDLTSAAKLAENAGRCFVGYQKTGAFDIPGDMAREMLRDAGNPNGRSNADILAPYWNGMDATRRPRDFWIIDTGPSMLEQDAAMYAAPFDYLEKTVKPERLASKVKDDNARAALMSTWWRLWRARPDMREAWQGMARVIATPEVSKHRVFIWLPRPVAPDKNLMITARDDDTTLGVLHSRFHELWALRMGTSLEDRPRYTPSTTFETFPFPEGLTPDIPAQDYAANPHAQAIGDAARALVEVRDRWLNPADWVDWQRTPEEEAAGFPARPVAKPGHEAALKKRTLTNLYNERPAWLANLHATLDKAVAAAYGWDWPLTDDEILRRLFELNQARSQA